MKCIEKAMNENSKKPKNGWWGFCKDDKRYLCRYHHIFAIFSNLTFTAILAFSMCFIKMSFMIIIFSYSSLSIPWIEICPLSSFTIFDKKYNIFSQYRFKFLLAVDIYLIYNNFYRVKKSHLVYNIFGK